MTIKEVSEKYQITQDTLRYYERIGMIPAVPRTSGGIRNYKEADLGWIELALCMRNAGLPVESMIEYVHLFQEGDETIPCKTPSLTGTERTSDRTTEQNFANVKTPGIQDQSV